MASSVESSGFMPDETVEAIRHPPRANVPSTVISGISKILKVMYTPTAIIPHTRPSDAASGRFFNTFDKKSILSPYISGVLYNIAQGGTSAARFSKVRFKSRTSFRFHLKFYSYIVAASMISSGMVVIPMASATAPFM